MHGAGVITSSWVTHQPSSISKSSMLKDFRKINKVALGPSRDLKVSYFAMILDLNLSFDIERLKI